MKKTIKKRVLALCFMLICFVIAALSFSGIFFMWRSATFIPVKVNGQYILANQLVRYIVYIVLTIVCIASFFGTMYYSDKLTAKPKRRRRKNK